MYWKATWMCLFVAFAGTMAGVNIINIYAKTLLDKIYEDPDVVPAISSTTATYLIGTMGIAGAILSGFTIRWFSRRALFIGFHGAMGIFLSSTAYFVTQKNANLMLLSMCTVVLLFQASNGSGVWVYSGDVANEVAMGVVLLVLMGLTLLQSLTTQSITNAIGIDGFFYIFAGSQFFSIVVFYFCMKESSGLTLA